MSGNVSANTFQTRGSQELVEFIDAKLADGTLPAGPLKLSNSMSTAGQMHSEDKALNDNTGISAHFGTYYYDGGNGFTYRLRKYGSGSGTKAENMGAGKHDPEGYVWMLNMDGHRGAQFNNFYTHIGCGAMPGFQNVVMVYANSW